ncbi:carboxypeptidase regulatory-like domain-containing protein [Streptomyces sp. WI04-05B]|uniref:carboxypeptidase regulatory-like domain-containing protein n=1 Tax=Streptomyces TaxID=1883 RepID=UPI0029BF026C|nr:MULTISPECIES: carboxypeptidase regulatory-like domain-containing protein [unclassified Streptomyces]MDX2540386.1 carboxypeptidase regulatory-like domain-containing protein [Streptomyces sp. WI04-05B]MDX2585181.1 carboxypeptidase regulatory-like domain-containing protein [Streptomyces sp. WI04-05A]
MIKVGLFRTRLAALTALFSILMTMVWALPQPATATVTTEATADTAATASTVPTHPLCARPDKPNQMACFAVARDDVRQTGKGFQPLLAPAGLGPADLQSAYDLPSDVAGAGVTVAIVDAYDNPNAEADLAVYRSQFGLPPCTTANGCFRKTDQRGGTEYPQPDQGWAGEIALDVDMVSAACPLCHILLVEADEPSIEGLGEAENTAVALGASYISNSWGGSESAFGDLPGDDYYKHPGVAITFSTGDNGYGNSYPATLPYVTAVGGTSLSRDGGTTRGWNESAWTGAGSGCSAYSPKPSFQTDRGCANRANADVSAVADPATGVTVYNTYEDRGWGVYGGTSASAPIIAATYALAGKPGAKTYPNAYPYAHTAAPDGAPNGALNDVTSGTNGTCATAYLCTAGPGWDGPTGLGTPNGTGAFTTGPYGRLTGKVTDPSAGGPVAGVRITAGANATTTAADGTYDMTLPAGMYDVTAAKFGYGSTTPAAVEVGDDVTVARDFTLSAQPLVTVSGRIRDGSGHGWPLSAGIQVTGEPSTRTYTDPATGRYTLELPANSTYTLQVDPVYTGYQVTTADLTVGGKAGRKDFGIPVDAAACVAPGYKQTFSEATETFDGTRAPAGWSVTGSGHTWRFDDPAGRGNLTGGSGDFAIADSGYSGDRQNTSLLSPVLDLTGYDTPAVRFGTFYKPFDDDSKADVDLSVDGGTTWSTVWHRDTDSAGPGTQSIALPDAAGKSAVQVRFRYNGDYAYYWQVDDVAFGGMTCKPVPGGLLYGTVTDRNTGRQLSGATVSGKTGAEATTAGDGSYVRFAPRTGRQQVAFSAEHYTTAAKKVNVKADHATRLDAVLLAGQLAISPAAVDKTVRKGKATTAQVTLRNTGSAPLTVSLTERSGDIPTATTARAAAPQYVPGDFTPDRLTKTKPKTTSTSTSTDVTPAASAWTSLADYPTPVIDNAVATGPDGRVYSVGGTDGASVLSGGYVYDPVTAAWTAIPGGHPTPRESPQSAFLNGKLYVTGGWTADGGTVTTTEVYDPQHRTWSTAAPVPAGYAAAASATLDGKWYLVGGCGQGYCTGATAVQVYDPATDTWAATTPYPEAISWLGCGAVSGTLYCAGGTTVVEGTRHGYAYDPATAAWTPITDLPIDLWASAATTADGRFLLSGGVSNLLSVVTSAGYAYDPAARTWTALPAASTPLYRAGGACGFYRVGGAPSVFDARANVEQLPGLDSCVPAADVRWLSTTPTTHTLAPGRRLTVTVRLDAGATAVDVAGTYTAALAVSTDTPYTYPVVPVRMTVR